MSNYHYNDQIGCKGSCINSSMYSELKDTTNYTCDQPCICRASTERSDKDKMYYNWFVLDQPMVLPPGKNIPMPKNKLCNQK